MIDQQPLPEMIQLHRRFEAPTLADPEGAVRTELEAAAPPIKPGARIAITVGSRGVANIALVVRAVAAYVRARGGVPFVVPAMGSHGGATAEGQRAVVEGYGCTEQFTGAPIVSSMETVELPALTERTGCTNRVFMDRAAWESDGVILVNRVKLHTDYHGFPESGLLKMATIGLGKHAQAIEIHQHGISGLKERILPTARAVLESGKIIAGVGLVENALEQTMVARAARPEGLEALERELLTIADASMARLPVAAGDLLIVDLMGKEISGVGMDTNVIGRIRVLGQPEPDTPRFASIVAGDLSELSHGNAIGVGMADVVTRRLAAKIDYAATYENVITSSFLERGKVPIVAENPGDAVRTALRGAGVADWRGARVVRIRSTLHLEDMMVSPPVWEELRARAEWLHIAAKGGFRPMVQPNGDLADWL